MRSSAMFFLFAISAFAGYASKATLAFPPASGSSTDTNITLAFSGSDAKVATTANGGEIQHTVTRVGITVPADLILTSDSTCNTRTGGYAWGIETYSPTTGALNGWVMIPSLTTGSSLSLTVCIGNAAVTTYQGGAQGAEFDTYTQAAYHFPNGVTASYLDFSSNSNNATNGGTTATSGQLDGAINFASASFQFVSTPTSSLGFASGTVSWWSNSASAYNDGADHYAFGQDAGGNEFSFQKYSDGNFYAGWIVGGDHRVVLAATALTYPVGSWIRYDLSWTSGGATTLYANGLSIGTHSGTAVANIATPLLFGTELGQGNYFNGNIDEFRIANTLRSGDWIATEYANQSSPPAISAFSIVSSGTSSARALLSQAFIF